MAWTLKPSALSHTDECWKQKQAVQPWGLLGSRLKKPSLHLTDKEQGVKGSDQCWGRSPVAAPPTA